MNNGGKAAEQVLRLPLEGFEVADRLSGSAAINITVLLTAVLKEEKKTKGKARLTSMLKSRKELRVFSVQQKDLAVFCQQVKRYGVIYCVLKDKNNRDPNALVDIIARDEGGLVCTVEGNVHDICVNKKWKQDSSYILGYGVPNY